MEQKVVVVILAFLGAVTSDVAQLNSCGDGSESVCTVENLQITPCHSKKECLFKKGINASMTFDFTPTFAATKMMTAAYWADSSLYLEDLGIADACQYTKCPTVAGQKQTLDYTVHIGKKMPQGTFVFRWVIWNEEDEQQKCCFKTTIKIRK